MRTIGAKFLLLVGAFALAFSTFVLYCTWQGTQRRVEELTARESDLALEFDLAVREYVTETVRPALEKRLGKDEFAPETMSSSFVARAVFEKVRQKLPEYVLKFSAENPRNPVNAAGPEELAMIRRFQDHPELDRWTGRLRIDGREYLAHVSPMRLKETCLRCHGRPEDAPPALLDRYGREAGFHRAVGDVAGLDTVAIPLDDVNAAVASEATVQVAGAGVGLVVLFGAVILAFRKVVAERLAMLAEHFRQAAARSEDLPPAPIPATGRDEIGVLAASFNALAARLRDVHGTLERRVAERTAALEAEVAERRRAEQALGESERRFRLAFEEAPVGMIIGVDDGVIAEANRALCRMTGYSPEEFKGRHVREFTHPDDRDLSAPQVKRLLAGEIPSFTVEKRYINKDGTILWAKATTAAAHDAQGRILFALGTVEDITQRKLAEEAVRREQWVLRQLLEVYEQHRKLVAYEIHDGVAQPVAGALMCLEGLLAQHPALGAQVVRGDVERIADFLRQGLVEARRLMDGLRPLILDEAGLLEALENLARVAERDWPVAVERTIDVSFEQLPPPLETAVFRIVQESLTNACRHSGSKRIRMSLVQTDSQLRIEIEDWGAGFDVEGVDASRFGVQGIRERAKLFGGRAAIRSAPGAGTRIEVELPLPETA